MGKIPLVGIARLETKLKIAPSVKFNLKGSPLFVAKNEVRLGKFLNPE